MPDTLTMAFKDLRKQGFLARQNFSCCGGCAGYELAQYASDQKDKGKEVKGCVFYHRQDAASRREGYKRSWQLPDGKWQSEWCHDFHLGYGNLNTQKHGDIGLPTVEVGKIVVETLKKYGIETEWNGSADERILVKESTIKDYVPPKPVVLSFEI